MKLRSIIAWLKFNRASWGLSQLFRYLNSRRHSNFVPTEASRIINFLLSSYQSEERRPLKYLEIGIETGNTLHSVEADVKVGVDPRPLFSTKSPLADGVRVVRETSDTFFEGQTDAEFDFVFLDGLHTFEQTFMDFLNSVSVTKSGGQILIDDVLPLDKYSAVPDHLMALRSQYREYGREMSWAWQGDVYRILTRVIGVEAFQVAVIPIQDGITNTRLLIRISDRDAALEFVSRNLGQDPYSEDSYEVSLSEVTKLLNDPKIGQIYLPA